ncbi:TraB/GumN family protein [Acetivibrio straminisolvens]|uniref:TraB/GumN family protein n=1 Tax=Acetivibrio straminisolvens TaxID=253314 RepID=UPI001FB118AF|nr:TraB/GumN family protein [Acetivibrio straminisolvens]
MADSTLYPLSKDILGAYDKSDVLVVEADVSNQEEAARYMQQRAMYEDENTLDKNIPEELYQKFVEFIAPYGIQEEVYNKLKPWYAALLVQNLQLMDNSYSGSLGVDMYFLSKAAGQKDILEIEGVKFQVDMFDSFSNELQCQFLASTLGSSEGNEDTETTNIELIAYMLKCWKEGNTAELEKMVKPEGEVEGDLREFNEKMWTLRDNNMAEKVREYLADPENKTYFVVVGAGHMVGSSGIVAQLEDEYKVEQIK